tara:strand:- start:6295 stop:7191 length:897 start_codon:yes stop_codon:yes gene_type:complete
MAVKCKECPLFLSGATSCSGCPETIALHAMGKVTPKDIVVANATGCTEIFSTQYPKTTWNVNYIHVAFENVAAVAAGIEAAFKKMDTRHKKSKIIALAGDGGTVDIGLQALSGMLERGHKVLYVMFDNEAYMNTGIQRSGATPRYAITTTSPAGKLVPGNKTWKKPIIDIVAAHQIPYIASASIGNIPDLQKKVKKALAADGPSFLDIHCPCPPGWRFPSANTVIISRKALTTGMWILYEIENGKLKINKKPEFEHVKEYLKMQGRFKHLTNKEITEIQKHVHDEYKRLQKLEKSPTS